MISHYIAFSKSLETIGCTDKVIPKLNFVHKNPIRTLPLLILQSLQEHALKQLEELQVAAHIERTVTECACPMVFVKKRTTNKKDPPQFRMALNLLLLNCIIQYSSYPLLKIYAKISSLTKFKFFTISDLKNANWQVALLEEYQDIFAFATLFGTFKNKSLVTMKHHKLAFSKMIE